MDVIIKQLWINPVTGNSLESDWPKIPFSSSSRNMSERPEGYDEAVYLAKQASGQQGQ